MIKSLKEAAIFSGLNDKRKLDKIMVNQQSYSAQEIVLLEGAPIKHIGIVFHGMLKTINYTNRETIYCTTYFTENQIFPEYLYFAGKKYYSYTLIAEKPSTIAWVSIEDFQTLIESDAKFLYELVLYMSKRGYRNQLMLSCLCYQSIRNRFAYWLIEINDIKGQGKIRLPQSQTILANELHVSRSALNQEMKRMQAEGLFTIEGKNLIITDLAGLKKLL